MDENTKKALLALIKGLTTYNSVCQRDEYSDPCIKGDNLKILIDFIKKL